MCVFNSHKSRRKGNCRTDYEYKNEFLDKQMIVGVVFFRDGFDTELCLPEPRFPVEKNNKKKKIKSFKKLSCRETEHRLEVLKVNYLKKKEKEKVEL